MAELKQTHNLVFTGEQDSGFVQLACRCCNHAFDISLLALDLCVFLSAKMSQEILVPRFYLVGKAVNRAGNLKYDDLRLELLLLLGLQSYAICRSKLRGLRPDLGQFQITQTVAGLNRQDRRQNLRLRSLQSEPPCRFLRHHEVILHHSGLLLGSRVRRSNL